ncbi:FKBP-type peptidyl-prolyl cis-trans isomerase [Motiliproteus sediminis]|uniref:FKBP-type peptidyl-prolyl cis-trans isomerase n=1 Tax=Motiliproteus sediminis TaxID=1468178 RepID=UPI001AF022AF|nr:peptidylprolyl isomerase [Motiliproteus sediminis]
MTAIGQGTEVTLHFTIELEDGSVVDSTRERSPATFTVGDGNLLPGFERALFGYRAGDQQRLRILPEQGFGMPNPGNVQSLPRSAFESLEQELEPGVVVSFADPSQGNLPGVIRNVGATQVEVDFNHPLAGRTLYFDVEVLSVTAV